MSYNFDRLVNAGISLSDAASLRRISMTLHRWFESECGNEGIASSWSVVRGVITNNGFEYVDDGKPFIENHPHNGSRVTYTSIADRETGAMKRLASIMANYPELTYYVQSDPRGCALYIGQGLTNTNYNNGIAVYK